MRKVMNKCGKILNFAQNLVLKKMKKIIITGVAVLALTLPAFTGAAVEVSRPGEIVADALTLSPAEEAEWIAAEAAYRAGEADAAVRLRQFIDRYPESVRHYEARLLLADALLSTDASKSLEIYNSLNATNPGEGLRADLAYHRAYALMRRGNFVDAEQGFASTASDRQYGANSRFYLGYIAYTRRDFSRALDYFGRVDRRSLPGAGVDYFLAQIYYSQGDYSRALSAAKALIANPICDDVTFRAEALRLAGESLFNLGDTAAGIDYLEQYAAVATNPELSSLYILGTACYKQGEWAKTVKYLAPVTASDSAMGQSAYLYVGEAYMKQGNKDAALMTFDAALRPDYDPGVREAAYYNYAVAKFSGGNLPFGSSVATFEDFLRRYPTGAYTAKVQEYLVAGYLTDRDYDTALASINRMSNPTDKVLAAKQQILYALGTRALAAEDNAAAGAYLEQALEFAGYDAGVAARTHLSLGEVLYRCGEYTASAEHVERYLATAPANDGNRALAYYDLGYAHFGNKDYDSAAEAFSRFIASPGSLGAVVEADALNRLGDVALYGMHFDDAIAYYKRASQRAPECGDYPMFQRAVIAGYNRNYETQIEEFNRLYTQFPSSSLIPEALLEQAEAYIQRGDIDKAIATYRRAVDTYPTTEQGRRGRLLMAMLMLNNGNREDAIAEYRRVVEMYPTGEEAAMAVAELQRLAAQDGTMADLATFLQSVENAPQMDVVAADRLTFEAAEEIYLRTGETARIEQYLTDYPTGVYRGNAWEYMMQSAVAADNTRDALSYAEAVIEHYPDSRSAEEALAVKAQALHSLGQGTEALEAWESLAQRASTVAMQNRARTGIMRVARDLCDYERVIAAADALLASSTAGTEDRNEAIFSRAVALDGCGRTAEAREAWRSIAYNTDDINGVKSAYYLAQSLYDSAEYSEAADATRAIIDSGTPHTYWLARAFILHSDILAAQNNTFEAREYLRSLRENYPGSETDIFQMIDTRLTELK